MIDNDLALSCLMFFVLSLGRHLVRNLFPFPHSTAQRIGKVMNNREVATEYLLFLM